jgi:hypothetical protein
LTNSSQNDDLPPFLNITDPLELEHIPLQVALLTMEIAAMRRLLLTLTKNQTPEEVSDPCPMTTKL